METEERPPGASLVLEGISILNITMEQALDLIFTAAASSRSDHRLKQMHFVNAHCINVAAKDPAYRQVMQQADAVFADGSGIRRAGTTLGTEIVANVNGTDMFPLLCRRCAQEGRKLYLLGAAPGAAEACARWADEYAGTCVTAGARDGFFTAEQQESVIGAINTAAPDILLVAMGVPRQELWLHEHREQLAVPVAMGVGGLFDFYSGRIRRAPLWMRRAGIEWVWRLLMEPGRMWKRYIIGNIVFLMRIRRIKRERGRV
jgi:N-acetylglucosaminyldiphosphoundecaprenol N-acetyl-beta-D-mannosaminyltransferase